MAFNSFPLPLDNAQHMLAGCAIQEMRRKRVLADYRVDDLISAWRDRGRKRRTSTEGEVVSYSAGSGIDPAFFVLLGPDYAGKSSTLAELAISMPSWHFISVDDAFLEPGHELVGKLRRQLISDTLPALGLDYSRDFAAAMLQTAVVHLRDQVAARDPGRPTLVDSYYYKILAKCRLLGCAPSMLAWWRSFPQPRRVIYLDVPPDVAWLRSGSGSGANRLEHYGDLPDKAAFETFQTDLHKVMCEEIRQLPVSHIDPHDSIAETALAIREVLSNEYP